MRNGATGLANYTENSYHRSLRARKRVVSLDERATFQLVVGDTITETIKEMTRWECLELNKQFRITFADAVRRGKPNGERLEMWKEISD